MITLRDSHGNQVLVNPEHIVTVMQASASSSWHGIHAIITTVKDQYPIEVRESLSDIQAMINEHQAGKRND